MIFLKDRYLFGLGLPGYTRLDQLGDISKRKNKHVQRAEQNAIICKNQVVSFTAEVYRRHLFVLQPLT